MIGISLSIARWTAGSTLAGPADGYSALSGLLGAGTRVSLIGKTAGTSYFPLYGRQ